MLNETLYYEIDVWQPPPKGVPQRKAKLGDGGLIESKIK